MRIFKTGEYSNKRRHSCKKMVLSAGMALMLAATPVTAMAGQVYGSNTGVTSANSVMNNIAAGLSMSNKIDVSTLKNNKKVGGDDITLDNDLTDWKNVTERKALSDKVSSWKAVISADYSTLYIAMREQHSQSGIMDIQASRTLLILHMPQGLVTQPIIFSLLRGMVEHRLRTAGMVI